MIYSKFQSSREEKSMSNSHLAALQSRHADIQTKIDKEERRPAPNMTLLSQLKKQKLKLKESLAGV
jgi:hypothetical protein